MNKKFKLWSLMLALVLAVSGMSLMISACAPDEGDPNTPDDPNPPVVEHTHTFDETKWEHDEHQHWHVATCEHKTEKSGVADHDFGSSNTCVCGYKKTVEVVAKCDVYCPKCGYCIDLHCTEDAEKCGHDKKNKYDFEAEEAVISSPEGGVPIEIQQNIDDKDKAGFNGYCERVGYCQGGGGLTMTFTFTVSEATLATLRVRCGKMTTQSVFTECMTVLVNGEFFDSTAYILKSSGTTIKAKSDFGWVNLGCIPLDKGENTIEIIAFSTDGTVGYNMDKIQLLTDATVEFTPTDNTQYRANGWESPENYPDMPWADDEH